MKFNGRRDFIKMSSLAASGFMLSPVHAKAHLNAGEQGAFETADELPEDGKENLHELGYNLLKRWGDGLLAHQVTDTKFDGAYGGILCPACATVHGRNADAILSLMYLAKRTGDKKYQTAALRLFDWMENKVSMPDGSWVSEIVISDWTGISVFTAVMLAETLTHFGDMLDAVTRQKWQSRLRKAGEFLYKDFTIHTGNINYPVTCSYGLALIGTFFKEPKFINRGKQLADEVLQYFTPNEKFLYGEGHPEKEPSAKGCYSVDLGYNVEESLPALALYAELTGDKRVLEVVLTSLKTHMEFMLPDGGWDNSWGTRNFKWTYWGSRTSDGCQTGYALMAVHDPRFYQVALQNTKLLSNCTHNGLLHGGPHYHQQGIPPCVHHTFCHSKALATMLLKSERLISSPSKKALPREQAYGVKIFRDINTWLAAKGKWRGTITGYDEEYLMKSGHASGGALSLLWHESLGTVIVASMTTYQLVENFNMQRDKDPNSQCLTPRFQILKDKHLYTNIHDLKADVQYEEMAGKILFKTKATLVDDVQAPYPGKSYASQINYEFGEETVKIHAECPGGKDALIKFMLPVISSGDETTEQLSDKEFMIKKPGGKLHVRATVPFKISPTTNGRIFNYVPGMQAVPLEFSAEKILIEIFVK